MGASRGEGPASAQFPSAQEVTADLRTLLLEPEVCSRRITGRASQLRVAPLPLWGTKARDVGEPSAQDPAAPEGRLQRCSGSRTSPSSGLAGRSPRKGDRAIRSGDACFWAPTQVGVQAPGCQILEAVTPATSPGRLSLNPTERPSLAPEASPWFVLLNEDRKPT